MADQQAPEGANVCQENTSDFICRDEYVQNDGVTGYL